MAFSAKVLKDSVTSKGQRLTTLELTYPRIVHAELLTHRVFSRNSASSRAIPIQKMIAKVWNDPVVPVWIGKNQSGMQANEELTGWRRWLAIKFWLLGSRAACILAWLLWKIGMHKQIANRVIEPWSWITVIVTATNWSNFFALRCHPDAQPELRRIADMARDVREASVPTIIKPGGYHLPLVNDDEARFLLGSGFSFEQIIKVSIGRCARVSYLTHDGKHDPVADIKLCDRLIASGHMSPTEHVACAVVDDVVPPHLVSNLSGWLQFRKTLHHEADFGRRLEMN
jgi:hypothetical protein